MGTINTSMQAVQKAQIDLGEVDNLPPLGQDMVLYSAHTCASINIKPEHTRTPNTFYVNVNRFFYCPYFSIDVWSNIWCGLPLCT